MNHAANSFFGRRKGKALRPGQEHLLATLYPRLGIDLSRPVDDLASIFSCRPTRIFLEIGFGGGEHLLHRLRRCPDAGFIGVEPFVNGMAKLLSALGEDPGNLRLYNEDATGLLDWLPPNSLHGVDLLYPDPWPKKRHWKRRFVNRTNLDRIARVLVDGGSFRFASDMDHYVGWTIDHCDRHPAFEWTARNALDWRQPFVDWPGTRYEKKALREGRQPAYLSFLRVRRNR